MVQGMVLATFPWGPGRSAPSTGRREGGASGSGRDLVCSARSPRPRRPLATCARHARMFTPAPIPCVLAQIALELFNYIFISLLPSPVPLVITAHAQYAVPQNSGSASFTPVCAAGYGCARIWPSPRPDFKGVKVRRSPADAHHLHKHATPTVPRCVCTHSRAPNPRPALLSAI